MPDEMKPIRVALADDHELVLEGLLALLQNEDDIQVVATAKNGAALLEAVRQQRPDVAVVDLKLPEFDGIACLDRIRQENLPVRVLILTAFSDGESMLQALEHEADGFALKTDPPSQTIAAIHQVAHGQMVFPSVVRQWLTERHRPGPTEELSERESQVLVLVAEGLTNAQIAEQLSVSESTVKFHLQHIYEKLGVVNRTEAAAFYHRLAKKP